MQNNNVTNDRLTDTDIFNGMRRIRVANAWATRLFFVVLFAVAIISFIIPLRPKFSEIENRKLTEFPKFSVKTLFSGDYFVGIDNWYSDTFPAREFFTGVNSAFSTLFGQSDTVVHGNVEKGDEIPEIDGNQQESNKKPETKPKPEPKPEPEPEIPSETIGALLLRGDTAYEYYNFVQSSADNYAAALTRAGQIMSGKANVYNIVVPNSMGIMLPEKVVSSINTSDQKAAINYIYSNVGGGVKTIDAYGVLKKHKKEYIYFRTDHHWTSLGAYYVYCELMNKKGVKPTTFDDYIKYEFTGFLGSFYNASGKHPNLSINPDTVVAYQPKITNEIKILGTGGWFTQKIISDMTGTPVSNVYSTFIRGDNPFSVITNPTLTDNSACIVIKESYGNAFVPYLVPHYQNVYVVDYRYFATVDARGLLLLQAETGAKDILFINNVSATRSKSLVGAIDYFVR